MVLVDDGLTVGARADRPATTVAPACRLRDAGKRFGATWACRHVDLEVFGGEVHAVIGENGAGKSTLMRMLHGLHAPDEGAVEVAGRGATLRSPQDAEAAGVGMAAQELDLFPDMSVVENLFVGRRRPRTRWGAFDRAAMRADAKAALERVGARIDVDGPARALSGAEGQMVMIARALMRDARVLILDEPTAALTEREAERLFAIVAELKADGVGLLYTSHRLEEVLAIADRVTVMRDGARVHCGPVAELGVDDLVRLMVGRPLARRFARKPVEAGEPLLEVKGLGRRGAFKDVAFTLRAGEIVGLSGLIGAGRSELAQAIFGLHPPDAGEIRVAGRPVTIRHPAAAVALGVAYAPEERRAQGLVMERSVAWNTVLAALGAVSPRGFVSSRREAEAAAAVRDLFHVRTAGLDTPVGALSGGNQQKVLLGKCFLSQPRVVLLDEPTRGVDVGAKEEIYATIDAMASRGCAVLLISSELNEVLALSDRVLVMHEGRLAAEFPGPTYDPAAVAAAAAGVSPSGTRH